MISDVLCIQHKLFIVFQIFAFSKYSFYLFVFLGFGLRIVFASSDNLGNFACMWRGHQCNRMSEFGVEQAPASCLPLGS